MTNLFALCGDYERRVRACDTPAEVDAVRREIGDAIDLMRSVAGGALQWADVLRHGGEAAYAHALKTAGDPVAAWPPTLRVTKIQPGDRL